MVAQDSLPRLCITANSRVELTHDDDFVAWRDILHEVWVESVPVGRVGQQGGSEECFVLLDMTVAYELLV